MDHDSRSFPSRDSRTETPTDGAEEARSGGAEPQSAPMVQNATDAQSSGIQADAAQNGDSESGEGGFSVSLIEWVEMFAGCFAVVLLIVTFLFRHSPVDGTSMVPTLNNGDILIIEELGYTPKQGDVIVAQSPSLGYDEPIVKRIIATGGQTVDIDFDTWTVTVDGEPLNESRATTKLESDGSYTVIGEKKSGGDYSINYIEGQSMLSRDMQFPLTVPEGSVFVMGDNRNGSLDSRSSRVGIIDNRLVVGHVIFRLFPISRFGTL